MDEVRRHLTALFEGGIDAGLRFLVCNRDDFAGRWFDSIDAGAEYAAAHAERTDVYLGVGMRRTIPSLGLRGLADEVDGIPGFYADVDVAGPHHKKQNLPPTIEAAGEILKALGVAPTLTIASGHGLQAYWLFPEPWIFETPAERERAATLSRRFGATIRAIAAARSFGVDSVFDLARVLRLAGTINHKRGERVPTRIIAEGRRVDLDSIEELLVAPEFIPGDDGAARVRFDVGFLALSEDRAPPSDALIALVSNHERARETWERRRTDLPDQSPSSYDFSLAVLAAKFGWTDQEIADLLVAWRRRHGVEMKTGRGGAIRLDYYQRTIANARKKVAEDREANPYAGKIEAAPLVNQDGKPADESARAAIFERISRVLDLPVVRVVQFGGGDDAIFSLVLAGGEEISLGTAAVLDSQKAMRAKLIPVARTIPQRLKADGWDRFLVEFLSVVEVVQNSESGRGAMFAAMLTDYLVSKSSILREAAADWTRAITTGDPFVRDGRLFVASTNVEAWAKFHYTRRVESRDLWVDLASWGFTNAGETARIGGRKIGRRYWSAPIDDLTDRHGFTLPLVVDPTGERAAPSA